MKGAQLASALLLAVMLAVPMSASEALAAADDKVCYEVADAYSVVVVCEYTGSSLSAAQEAEPSAKWMVYQLCKDGTSGGVEACANPRVCTVSETTGTLYAVFKDGARVGVACLTADEAGDVDDPPIRILVIRTFENLDWSASEIVVQPPGGKTLVNFDTNFYTTNSAPTSIAVQLQGSNVVVTARPIAYRWNFGDGTSITTASPGAPYPSLDVAHAYEARAEVAVSVDTQYGDASFTVNGGPPEAIPSTIWVTGESQELDIVEALPQLVLR